MKQALPRAAVRRASWSPAATGWVGLAQFYGLGVSFMPAAAVSLEAWLLLWVACALSFSFIWARRGCGVGPARWLAVGFYAALFAAIFYGANRALDALHGPARRVAHVAEYLGGLELWFVLCPGVVSVALASAWRSWLGGRLPSAPRPAVAAVVVEG